MDMKLNFSSAYHP
jgi:hypothetical protein